MEELVSIIMSFYNETEEEFVASLNSVLNQTYRKIEVILVNDNPKRETNSTMLSEIHDPRVRVLQNDKNRGLVYSLNRALHYSRGRFIARMDADDISRKDRIEKQVYYLKEEKYDLIGSWIRLFEKNPNEKKRQVKFPCSCSGIKKSLKYGGCVPHPTWFGTRDIFEALCGYRDIDYCEDYDFLLRALSNDYRIGNYPDYLLYYRTREQSVSASNKNRQLLIRRYLSKCYKQDIIPSLNDIESYLHTSEYNIKLSRLMEYEDLKQTIRTNDANLHTFARVIKSEELYMYIIEKIVPKLYTLE